MEAETQQIDVHGVDHDGPRGVWVRGEEPKELVLSDGSRLRLESAEAGPVQWRREDVSTGRSEALSTGDATALAGDYSRYVAVRTRSEVEWLRAVSDWCRAEAGRLDHELSRSRA